MQYTLVADALFAQRFQCQGRAESRREDDRQARAQLEQFAGEGLRTLMLAQRELPPAEYDAWAREYEVAKAALGDTHNSVKQDEFAATTGPAGSGTSGDGTTTGAGVVDFEVAAGGNQQPGGAADGTNVVGTRCRSRL